MSAKDNKLKLFVENMLVYGLGSIMSKLIPLLMTFLFTYLLKRETFGVSDNTHTVQSFGAALAGLGMYDAMYRLFFERDDAKYKKEICSTTMAFTGVTSIIVVILMVIFKNPLAWAAFKNYDYSYLIYIAAAATLVTATNNIISAPTRMQNKRKVFLITNTVTPIISYSISIPLILKGHALIAMPLAAFVAGFIMEIAFGVMNHSWFSLKFVKKEHLKPLLTIAIPLMPNFLIYWVFKSCDKYMIVHLIDQDANGLYSVSARLGQCSQIIYQAFSNGWQFFAFSTMKEKNQVKNNSLVFEYLGGIAFVATAAVCAVMRYIFLLMGKDYREGYIPAAYLFLAPLLLMLFQVACNQFIVIKKTWPNLLILSSGAIVNVVLNWVLIPIIGIEGAAVATLAGYVISDIIVCIVLIKMKLMELTPRFYIMTLAFAAYFIGWRFLLVDRKLIAIPVALLFTAIVAALYRDDLKILVDKIKNRKKKAENV